MNDENCIGKRISNENGFGSMNRSISSFSYEGFKEIDGKRKIKRRVMNR